MGLVLKHGSFINSDPHFRKIMAIKASFHCAALFYMVAYQTACSGSDTERCRRGEFESLVNPKGILKVSLTCLEQVLESQRSYIVKSEIAVYFNWKSIKPFKKMP